MTRKQWLMAVTAAIGLLTMVDSAFAQSWTQTSLVSPVVWSTNAPAAVVINGQNVVTNLVSGPQQFFRLRQ